MNTRRSFQVARVLGIPIMINVSWLATLVFVTAMLATRLYPTVLPPGSSYRDDQLLHWAMALTSGLIFFASILLHELAHSVVALKQGIPVKSITLFMFGGVAQITAESRRPRHEFFMAVAGPLASLMLAGLFLAGWWLIGLRDSGPLAIVLQWLCLMNVVVAAFNMAPGFPMDGGRVLRSILWGISGNLLKATRIATVVGRGFGFALIAAGALIVLRVIDYTDAWSGIWFGILGMYIESSARQSWLQAKALHVLAGYKAADLMTPELETARREEQIRYLTSRGGRHFIFFVTGQDDAVDGVLTDKETAEAASTAGRDTTAGDLMVPRDRAMVAAAADDGSQMLQRMEAHSIWYLPVVDEGRLVGVVSKDSLLRLLAHSFVPKPRLAGQR